MSSLIYRIKEDEIIVATDTAISNAETKEIVGFGQKSIYLSSAKTIIACTGFSGFISAWFSESLNFPTCYNIDDLNSIASGRLEAIFNWIADSSVVIPNCTSSIYHFGFTSHGTIKGYAFRSENDFKCEELGYCIGIKPGYPNQENEAYDLPTSINSMIKNQIKNEQNKSTENKVVIGGEIYVSILNKDSFSTYKDSEFDDFAEIKERLSIEYSESIPSCFSEEK